MREVRHMLAIMAVLLVSGTQLMARGSGQTAFELNEAARSCMWNDMDSAERYARFALDTRGLSVQASVLPLP